MDALCDRAEVFILHDMFDEAIDDYQKAMEKKDDYHSSCDVRICVNFMQCVVWVVSFVYFRNCLLSILSVFFTTSTVYSLHPCECAPSAQAAHAAVSQSSI